MAETPEFDKRIIVDFGVILWSVVFILLEIEGGWILFSWKSKKYIIHLEQDCSKRKRDIEI